MLVGQPSPKKETVRGRVCLRPHLIPSTSPRKPLGARACGQAGHPSPHHGHPRTALARRNSRRRRGFRRRMCAEAAVQLVPCHGEENMHRQFSLYRCIIREKKGLAQFFLRFLLVCFSAAGGNRSVTSTAQANPCSEFMCKKGRETKKGPRNLRRTLERLLTDPEPWWVLARHGAHAASCPKPWGQHRCQKFPLKSQGPETKEPKTHFGIAMLLAESKWGASKKERGVLFDG